MPEGSEGARPVECPRCDYSTIAGDEPPTSLTCPECKSAGVAGLRAISGIGREKAKTLWEHGYEEIEDVAEATQSELAELPGFGATQSARIKADIENGGPSHEKYQIRLREVEERD